MRGAALARIASAALLVIGVAALPGTAVADSPLPISSIRAQLAQLPVASEKSSGYDRDKFGPGWRTQSDGCDTRDHVLREEARKGKQRGCDVKRGKWRSRYDGKMVRAARRLDIDHMVPLAEAWASGASKWGKRAREDFANDLDFRDALVAVTASTNRSKSDRDPAEWMPPRSGSHCWYTQAWISVKYKYNLSVDPAEKKALQANLAPCTRTLVPINVDRHPVADNGDKSTTTRMWVAPDRTECTGVAPMMCLQVASSPNDPYTLFYDTIKGYTHQAGVATVLDVQVTDVANPPADGSSKAYTLLSIIDENPASTYANCTEARAAGVTPIRQSDSPSRYAANKGLDRNNDGVACE